MILKEVIKDVERYGIKVLYTSLPASKGRRLSTDNRKFIFLDYNLNELEAINVLLHEFEHFQKEHYFNRLASPHYFSKMEAEAEKARIQFDLSDYTTNTPKEFWNTYHFLKHYKIDEHFESYVDKQLKRLK